MPRTHRVRLIAVAGTAVLLSATTACAGSVAPAADTSHSATTIDQPSPSAAPTVDPSPAPAAASGAEPASPPTPTGVPGPTAPAPTATSSPMPPQIEELMHGSDVWGAYLAVRPAADDPLLQEANDRVRALGYHPSGGQVGCDGGAAEALGLDFYHHTTAVYFDTRADAEAFIALVPDGSVGLAQVTLYCLD